MPADDRKRKVTMRAATLVICFVCLAGLSALAAYQVARFEYQKQLTGKDLQIGAIRRSEKALAGRNVELLRSLRKIEDEYGRLYTAKTQAGADGAKQEHHEPDKDMLSAGAVLGPTWVRAGKVISLFDGNLRIVLKQASAGDNMCGKGRVVGKISSGAGRQKLCLWTGAPAKFTYRGANYRIDVSGIAGKGNVYHYYISISH